jgi:hypothetical protein
MKMSHLIVNRLAYLSNDLFINQRSPYVAVNLMYFTLFIMYNDRDYMNVDIHPGSADVTSGYRIAL